MTVCPVCRNQSRLTPCPTCAAPEKRRVEWQGIHKLQEEMGELQQVLAKMCAYGGTSHWGGDLRGPLREEMADVYAALTYFTEMNHLDTPQLRERYERKLAMFRRWILTGISR